MKFGRSIRVMLNASFVALSLGLVGCADRDASIKAATQLSEALYPGELELYGTSLQKDHYIVTFAVRNDPVTRIDLNVDPKPADCRLGTKCEDRFRKAYAVGLENGKVLKALSRSFRSCGVPLLAVTGLGQGAAYFHPQIELNLTNENQQEELDRLTPCLKTFRQESKTTSFNLPGKFRLHIFPTVGAKPTSAPDPLTREHSVGRKRYDGVTYFANWVVNSDVVKADDLRLYPHYSDNSGLDKKLAEIAADFLKTQPGGGHVPTISFGRDTKLDSQRIDLIRTYILACSEFTSGQGRCKTDLAVRIIYDLTAGKATEVSLVKDIQDAHGNLKLPELPGR
jgi:hypothetical protein